MEPIRKAKKYKVDKSYLTYFLREYWFIPSDALQRGIEANAWGLCRFKRPILDIGIGNGKMSDFIFRNIPLIDVGIDSDKNGLESAKKTKKYIKILHANAESMPFENASFNTVVSNSTFEHIVNDLKAVSEVSRVLKEEGLFFATVPSKYLQKWVLEYEGKKNKAKSKENLVKFNKRANHLHYRSLDNWKRNLKKNNLEIVFCKYFFPKETALLWYKLFKRFTCRLGNREIWSILGDSKITTFLPKSIIINFLKNIILKNAYRNGLFINKGYGAQLFMIAKKI